MRSAPPELAVLSHARLLGRFRHHCIHCMHGLLQLLPDGLQEVARDADKAEERRWQWCRQLLGPLRYPGRGQHAQKAHRGFPASPAELLTPENWQTGWAALGQAGRPAPTLYTMRCRLTALLPSNSLLTTTISTCRPACERAVADPAGAPVGTAAQQRQAPNAAAWSPQSTPAMQTASLLSAGAPGHTHQAQSYPPHRTPCCLTVALHVLHRHKLRIERALDLGPHLLHQLASDVVVHAAAGRAGCHQARRSSRRPRQRRSPPRRHRCPACRCCPNGSHHASGHELCHAA